MGNDIQIEEDVGNQRVSVRVDNETFSSPVGNVKIKTNDGQINPFEYEAYAKRKQELQSAKQFLRTVFDSALEAAGNPTSVEEVKTVFVNTLDKFLDLRRLSYTVVCNKTNNGDTELHNRDLVVDIVCSPAPIEPTNKI